MYIVISMPYRRSIAVGVVHFMRGSWFVDWSPDHDPWLGPAIGDHHERGLMIFMSPTAAAP
jgi:hypothetical protein